MYLSYNIRTNANKGKPKITEPSDYLSFTSQVPSWFSVYLGVILDFVFFSFTHVLSH